MMYVFENGRVIYNKNYLSESDEGKYLKAEESEIPSKIGKYAVIRGCSLKTKEIYCDFYDLPEEPVKPEPQPTEQDLLNAQILLNQAEQDAKLQEIDEALALILSNQEGGVENVL